MNKPYVSPIDVDYGDEKKYQKFTTTDPFNPENTITGYYRNDKGGKRTYGIMLITKVNNWSCEQWIMGVPKMGYPYRWNEFGDMIWDSRNFPNGVKYAVMTEKVDGTAIVGFKYRNHKGDWFVSYRTRQTPFLIGGGKYGDFLGWWQSVLQRFPDIPKLVLLVKGSLIMELYGKNNKIGILYENEMSAKILFRVDMQEGVLPASKFYEDVKMDELIVLTSGLPPCVWYSDEFKGFCSTEELFREAYWMKLNEMNAGSWKDSTGIHNYLPLPEKSESALLCEGIVWFVQDNEDRWKPIKAKSKVMLEHQGDSQKIPRIEVAKAVSKALTETNEPSMALIKSYLLEDYPEWLVDKYEGRINKVYEETKKMAMVEDLEKEVIELYEQLGLDFLDNKNIGDIMRAMSEKFGKSVSKKIFGILSRHTGRK